MTRRVLPIHLLAAIVLLGLLPGLASAQGTATSLNILLTNDDGYDAPGLKVMREALVAAGHRVTVVAPATDFSGAGASMTSGVIKFEKKSEGVWAVHGTPADSASIGVAHVLRDTTLDLVVSGTNRGQNLGASANSSGTVGAAIVASQRGVPAIAVSAGIGTADGTASAYVQAAQFTTRLIAALAAARPVGNRLLPDRVVINVNWPATPIAGMKIAPLSTRGSFVRQYLETGTAGEVRSQLAAAAPPAGETDTDLALFTRGFVTLSILDGNLGMDASRAPAAVQAILERIATP